MKNDKKIPKMLESEQPHEGIMVGIVGEPVICDKCERPRPKTSVILVLTDEPFCGTIYCMECAKKVLDNMK